MKLRPAILHKGKLYVGDHKDHHNNIAERHGIPAPDKNRGFTSNGANFFTREQGEAWMKKHEPEAYKRLNELPDGLHSENYAKAHGVEQKPDPGPPTGKKVNLKEKTAIIYDRGLYLYLAERLAKDFKKVYYYLPQSEPYPSSKLHPVATGIEGVERCFDFWKTIEDCDIVIFPDTYDGELQEFLRRKGYLVFGSGRSEIIETDKIFFMEYLEKTGLPIPRTYLADGLDDLLGYLEKEGGTKWLKGMTRGDFETKKFTNMDHFQPFIDDLKFRLGKRVETIEVLVQDPIESKVEIGYDGFCVDGKFTKNCLAGYEVKDKSFVTSVVENPSKVVQQVNDAFAPLFEELGYRGAYSTEIRMTDKDTGYYIDPTTRFGSPPGELMSLLYEDYGQIIWDVASGVVPEPKPKAKYGVQMVLTSDWYRDEHEMYIEFPDRIREHVKLSNYYRKDGKTYIVPNDTEQYFGSVVAIGKTLDEAITKCKEVLESIVCEKFHWDERAFDESQEIIEAGRKFGIEF